MAVFWLYHATTCRNQTSVIIEKVFLFKQTANVCMHIATRDQIESSEKQLGITINFAFLFTVAYS